MTTKCRFLLIIIYQGIWMLFQLVCIVADPKETSFATKFSVVLYSGDIQSVNNTSFDFTRPRFLREVLQNVTIDNIKMGFDHTYCLRGAPGRRVAAR